MGPRTVLGPPLELENFSREVAGEASLKACDAVATISRGYVAMSVIRFGIMQFLGRGRLVGSRTVPKRSFWPRLDAPLWLSPLRARGSRLFDVRDGNCAARSAAVVRLPVLAGSLLPEHEPSRSSSRWVSAEGRDLRESPESPNCP